MKFIPILSLCLNLLLGGGIYIYLEKPEVLVELGYQPKASKIEKQLKELKVQQNLFEQEYNQLFEKTYLKLAQQDIAVFRAGAANSCENLRFICINLSNHNKLMYQVQLLKSKNVKKPILPNCQKAAKQCRAKFGIK